MIRRRFLVFCTAASLSTAVLAAPANFLSVPAGDLAALRPLLIRPDIAGVRVSYSWKMLEPERGRYDFSAVEHDLTQLRALHRKLLIQVPDRAAAAPDLAVPDYLQDPAYRGGIVAQGGATSGWVVQQWNPSVQKRYQALLAALGKRFDGRVYGISLPETALGIDAQSVSQDFSCTRYFNAEVQNMRVARSAFHRSKVLQFVDSWPCEHNNDHRFMQRVFAFAANNDIGLGVPDAAPDSEASPFFLRYKGRLPLVAAGLRAPSTGAASFARDPRLRYASEQLGAKVLLWAPDSPWLQQK